VRLRSSRAPAAGHDELVGSDDIDRLDQVMIEADLLGLAPVLVLTMTGQRQQQHGCGAGLLRLSVRTDQVAIRIGGYLGSLARLNQYQPARVRVGLLLERIGMADRYPNNPQRLRNVVEAGLRKLQTAGVIAAWDYTDADATEPDMDDPVDLAALADATWRPWRRRTLEIAWPEALARNTPRLEASRRKALAEAERRKARAEAERRRKQKR
jgi:hypothetical protein